MHILFKVASNSKVALECWSIKSNALYDYFVSLHEIAKDRHQSIYSIDIHTFYD